MDREPDSKQVIEILKNLAPLIPKHPDLIALQWACHQRFDEASPPAVAFPPMLQRSYQFLLQADAAGLGALVQDSLAERIAPSRILRSLWTSWRELSDEVLSNNTRSAVDGILHEYAAEVQERVLPKLMEVFTSPAKPQSAPSWGSLRGIMGGILGKNVEGVLGGLIGKSHPSDASLRTEGEEDVSEIVPTKQAKQGLSLPTILGQLNFNNPAVAKIVAYLSDLKSDLGTQTLSEFALHLQPQAIAHATGLPLHAVEKVVEGIKTLLKHD